MFFLTVLRAMILLSTNDPKFSPIHIFSTLVPGAIVFLFCIWRAYINELQFRLQFIKSKRVEMQTARVRKEKQVVKEILEIMLPESIIPRLEASNFKFSTVSDRIEEAVCIFVEFFHGKKEEFKKIGADRTCQLINRAFIEYDDLLVGFPEFEKLKTLGSKVLLFGKLEGNDKEKFGERLTLFVRETYLHMAQNHGISEFASNSFNSNQDSSEEHSINRDIRVGVAKGSVVAGIVGQDKFCYDVYGDTVNTASRMQTLEKGGPILITAETYLLFSNQTRKLLKKCIVSRGNLNKQFLVGTEWLDVGMHQVKGKGLLRIYTLNMPSNYLKASKLPLPNLKPMMTEYLNPEHNHLDQETHENQTDIVRKLVRPSNHLRSNAIKFNLPSSSFQLTDASPPSSPYVNSNISRAGPFKMQSSKRPFYSKTVLGSQITGRQRAADGNYPYQNGVKISLDSLKSRRSSLAAVSIHGGGIKSGDPGVGGVEMLLGCSTRGYGGINATDMFFGDVDETEEMEEVNLKLSGLSADDDIGYDSTEGASKTNGWADTKNACDVESGSGLPTATNISKMGVSNTLGNTKSEDKILQDLTSPQPPSKPENLLHPAHATTTNIVVPINQGEISKTLMLSRTAEADYRSHRSSILSKLYHSTKAVNNTSATSLQSGVSESSTLKLVQQTEAEFFTRISKTQPATPTVHVSTTFHQTATSANNPATSILTPSQNYTYQSGNINFQQHIKALINPYTLLFLSPKLEALFCLRTEKHVSKTTATHSQYAFIGSILILLMDGLYAFIQNPALQYGYQSISTLVSGGFVLVWGGMWYIRKSFHDQCKSKMEKNTELTRKVQTFKGILLGRPAFNGIIEPEQEDQQQRQHKVVEEEMNWAGTISFIRFFARGKSGFLASSFLFSLYIALLILFSACTNYLLSAEALVYINMVYIAFLDCTHSFALRAGTMIVTSFLLIGEMTVLGKSRFFGLIRLIGVLIVLTWSIYMYVVSMKTGFLVSTVLVFSQRQLDAGEFS
jgi:hypothetical protein